MIHVIAIHEKEKWNNVVKSFENYDVVYLNDYAKAFRLHGDGEPILIYYEGHDTRAINVVMKRDIAEAPGFKDKLEAKTWLDLSTPYGYGGFWTEGDRRDQVEQEYVAYCRDEGYISEFVRFHLYGSYQTYFQGEMEHRIHNIVRDLSPAPEELLQEFEYKVRKNLKRAESAGLKVEIDPAGRRLKDFLDIYHGTMLRNHAKAGFNFSEDFFKAINELQGNCVYLHALLDGRVISSELILYGSENCYSFLGGTDSRYYELRPNDFLKYEIIKWAREQGLKRFILGGGHGEDDGIFRFKKSFAPAGICDFTIGKRIFDQDRYDCLVALREGDGSDLDTLYFPAYRRQQNGVNKYEYL